MGTASGFLLLRPDAHRREARREMSDAAQPTADSDEKKSRGLGSYVLWAFVAVMVYVLSSGPVLKAVGTSGPLRQVAVIYWPLHRAYWRTPLRTPLGMYWHLWFPRTYEKNGQPCRATRV
jgi:hypothetical protein